MKQDQTKNAQAKKFMNKVQQRLKQVFLEYKKDVQAKNYQHNGGTMLKNQKSQKIYADLLEVSRQLKNVEKQLKQCQKLRKQRKVLFEEKTAAFSQAINQLITKKNIKVKTNQHISNLANRSKQLAAQTLKFIRLFKTESSVLCGKSYDYKPSIEKAFLQMSELGYLWQNLSSFQSITNESVKQVFLPIQYKAAHFQKLENQLLKSWPQKSEPIIKYVTKEVPVSYPQIPVVQASQIRQQTNHLQLAHQYLFGFTRPQEIAKAVEIYKKQADKTNTDPTALNALGALHEQGKGFPKDLNKAFKFYMRSAEKGDPQGLYKVGQYLEKGILNFKHHFNGLFANRDAQVRGGIQYYEKAASKGHLDSLTDLGFIYQKGVLHQNEKQFFIQPHPQHSKKYYEKAKEKQFPRALNNLGNLLICQNTQNNNLSQNANLQKGIKYLTKARQLGCAKASINLGKCYLNGIGVMKNSQQARALFKETAQLGDVQGRLEYLRSYIGTNLEEEQTINQLADTARMVLIQNRNNPQALFLMGLLQEKGIGVSPNKQSSFYYVSAAARLQYPPALTRLGDYYYSGYFVNKNYENAKILYEKAAERNDSQAYVNLALMQQKGLLPIGCNLGNPEELYKRAEQLGNTNALLLRGLKKQINLARNEQVIKAAGQGNYHALKILTQNDIKFASVTSQAENLKKISTFYMKEKLPPKRKFDSFI